MSFTEIAQMVRSDEQTGRQSSWQEISLNDISQMNNFSELFLMIASTKYAETVSLG